MARIAYVRVSTEEQNTARQDVRFSDYDKVFTDKASGKNTDRPELQRMLDYIREGDTVTVESYSRLARSTKDLLTIVDKMKEKGVAFISLKENVDTSTPQGEFMMQIFASLAEFERKQTLQRQAEGIAEAKKRDAELKAQGKPAETYKGRKPIETDRAAFLAEIKKWQEGKQTARETMTRLGLKPNTFYRRVKEITEDAENEQTDKPGQIMRAKAAGRRREA